MGSVLKFLGDSSDENKGELKIELFGDFVCPFCRKTMLAIFPDFKIENCKFTGQLPTTDITLRFQTVVQSWHPQSSMIALAMMLVKKHYGDYKHWQAMLAFYKNADKLYDKYVFAS